MRIGWLSSGRDPAARDLLRRPSRARSATASPLDIACVFCDRSRARSPRATASSTSSTPRLPAVTLSSARSWKEWWRVDTTPGHGEGAHKTTCARRGATPSTSSSAEQLRPFSLDLLVLAGYMLVISPDMCERYAMINLHPALPGGPTGTWQEVIWELLRKDARETGALINLVTPSSTADRCSRTARSRSSAAASTRSGCSSAASASAAASAPSRSTRERREPLFAEIRRGRHGREIPLLYQTVRQFVEGRLRSPDKRCAVFGDLPLDLTEEVEADLAARDAGAESPDAASSSPTVKDR